MSLACTGCAENSTKVAAALPEDTAYASMLVVDAGGFAIFSTGLFDFRTTPKEIGLADLAEETAQVILVGYTTERLALAAPPSDEVLLESKLAFASPGVAELPEPSYVAQGSWITAGVPIMMTERPTSGLAFTAGWLPKCPRDACAIYPISNTKKVALPGSRSIVFAMTRLDDESALVVSNGGEFYRANEMEATRLTELSTTTPFMDAVTGSDGRIWLLGEDRLVEVELPDRLITRALVFAATWESRMAVSSDGSELYIVDRRGGLQRYDAGGLTTLIPRDERSTFKVDVDVTTLPGGAAAVFQQTGLIAHVSANGIELDDFLAGPAAVSYSPKLGLIVGTDPDLGALPGLYRRVEGTWVKLARSEDAGPYFGMWPLDHGLVTGGGAGSISYFEPHLGVCGPKNYQGGHIFSLLKLGGRVFMGGISVIGNSGTTVVVGEVSETELPGSCGGYQ
ncbi:MAG: hypothetical protein HY791_25060 [Deltaproteobacteria bacterium]|nr:hypothetical protein [Deltaproteobacteria bacterium]